MPAEPTLSFSHLVIPVLGLLIPILAILAHYGAKAYAVRQRHLTLREFVRAGQPVPPELLAEVQDSGWNEAVPSTSSTHRMLLAAVVNIGLGLGLAGLFAVMVPASWLWAIGLVPLALGLSLGLLWMAQQRQGTRG